MEDKIANSLIYPLGVRYCSNLEYWIGPMGERIIQNESDDYAEEHLRLNIFADDVILMARTEKIYSIPPHIVYRPY